MRDLLHKKLVAFGLSDKEAQIYLALLALGAGTANEVARQSGINRSSAYVVLESLRNKGLAGISDDKKVRRYVAASPDTLLYEAEVAAKKRTELKNDIEALLPDLKVLYKDTREKPIVRVFEGKSGVINALEETLKNKEKLMRVYSSHENWLSADQDFGAYFKVYLKKRSRLGIKMKGIHPAIEVSRRLVKITPSFDRFALIPSKKYSFPAEICVFDDKIGYISTNLHGSAVIIESKGMADVLKNVFDLAWEEAKRLHQAALPKRKRKN